MARKNQPGCPCGCSNGPCTQTFCITSCLGPIADFGDATVSVYESESGQLLASGTADDSGCVTLSWSPGAEGDYYVTVAVDGGQCYADTLHLVCGGGTTIALNALCLCFGGSPPSSLSGTWKYTYNGVGPITGTIIFNELAPGSGLYYGSNFIGPFDFSFYIDFTACLLWSQGYPPNENCGSFPFVSPSTCSPLNLIWSLQLNCTLFGSIPPDILGTLTVTT